MKRLLFAIIIAMLIVMTGCGEKSTRTNKETARTEKASKQVSSETPNQIFNRYAKARNLSFTFRGKVWARFISLPKDEQAKAASVLARMMEKDK